MKKVFEAPRALKKTAFHYCPGCGHSIIHRLLAEVVDELGIRETSIGLPPTGCAATAFNYLDVDMGEAPHGRALAVAAGLKKALPDRVVFAYQGYGDLAAAGAAEAIHAANRGENLTVLYVNNGVWEMPPGPSGPHAPNSRIPAGTTRECRPAAVGNWLDISAMLALAKGSAYIERVAVGSPPNIIRAKKALMKAFRTQMEGKGFALVELLSPCPAYFEASPAEAMGLMEKHLAPFFPLGVLKDATAG